MPRGRVNWIQVRTAYLIQGWSMAKCAEEFGIDPTTVRKKAAAEGWTQQRRDGVTAADLIATNEVAIAVATSRAEFQAGLNRQLSGMFALLVDGAADIAAAKPGRARAETRRAVIESYALVAKTGRENMGLQPGQSTFTDVNDDGRKRVVFVDIEGEIAETA